mgnify:CR=1 FL=1|jgi:hypothetical protein
MQHNNYSSIKSVLVALLCTLVMYSGSPAATAEDTLFSAPAAVEIAIMDYSSTDDTLHDNDLQASAAGANSCTSNSLFISRNYLSDRTRLNFNTVRGSPAPVL